MSSTGRAQDVPVTTAVRTHLGFGLFGSIAVLPLALRDLFRSPLLAAFGGAGFLHPAFL